MGISSGDDISVSDDIIAFVFFSAQQHPIELIFGTLIQFFVLYILGNFDDDLLRLYRDMSRFIKIANLGSFRTIMNNLIKSY